MRASRHRAIGLAVLLLAAGFVWSGEQVAVHGLILDAAEAWQYDLPSLEAGSGTDLETALPPPAPDWGTSDWITLSIGPGDFVRRWGTTIWNGEPDLENLTGVVPKSGEDVISMGAPVHLPTGARLEFVRLVYYDSHPGSDPSVGLYRLDGYGPSNTLIAGLAPSSFSGGNRYVDFGPLNHTVDNDGGFLGQPYHVLVLLDRSIATPSQQEKIYNLLFWYKLQVSPAPATATFSDVPVGAFAFQHIEALVDSGITAGCGGGNFCPNSYVTRAQMAVFLAKALGLHYPF